MLEPRKRSIALSLRNFISVFRRKEFLLPAQTLPRFRRARVIGLAQSCEIPAAPRPSGCLRPSRRVHAVPPNPRTKYFLRRPDRTPQKGRRLFACRAPRRISAIQRRRRKRDCESIPCRKTLRAIPEKGLRRDQSFARGVHLPQRKNRVRRA